MKSNKIYKLSMLIMIAISSAIVSATEIIDHTNHEELENAKKEISTYSKEYNEINNRMHENMTVTDKDNADRYFVESMIAHHIGAVEMAELQLKYGTDPQLRQLALDIIKTQNMEIKQMQDWLTKH